MAYCTIGGKPWRNFRIPRTKEKNPGTSKASRPTIIQYAMMKMFIQSYYYINDSSNFQIYNLANSHSIVLTKIKAFVLYWEKVWMKKSWWHSQIEWQQS